MGGAHFRKPIKDPILLGLRLAMVDEGISLLDMAARINVGQKVIEDIFYPSVERSRLLCHVHDIAASLGLQLSLLPSAPSSPAPLEAVLSATSFSLLSNRELATLAATSATALSQRLNGEPTPGSANGGRNLGTERSFQFRPTES